MSLQVCARLPQRPKRGCGPKALRGGGGGDGGGEEAAGPARAGLKQRLRLLRRCCANLQARSLVLSLPPSLPLRDACARGECADDRLFELASRALLLLAFFGLVEMPQASELLLREQLGPQLAPPASASASSLSSTRPTTGGSTTSARGRAWQRRAPTGCRPGRDRWRSTASTTRASSADGFGSCHLPCLRKPLRQPAWRPARHQAAPTCRPGARRLGRRGSSPRPQQLASAAP